MKTSLRTVLLALTVLLCAGCGRGQGGGETVQPDPAPPEEPASLFGGEDGEEAAVSDGETVPEPAEPLDLSAPDDTVDGLPPVPEGMPADAAAGYVLDQYGDWFDGEITLCSPLIYRTDYSDPADVQLWGYFWMTAYEPEGTVMVTTGAGGPAGLFHLKTTDSGYEVVSFDMVSDGADFEPDVRRICGGDEALEAMFLTTDQTALQEARIAALRTYAAQNGVTVTAYRDPDGTEVSFG